jgi:peroxiredoxin
LRQHKDRFEDIGARVLLVGMGSTEEAEEFRKRFDLPFSIVCDPDRKLYKQFTLQRMKPWDLLSPALALRGISAMAQGHLMGIPSGDVRQLPGVFVIDKAGMIRYSHYARDAADHPEPDEILEVLAGGDAD